MILLSPLWVSSGWHQVWHKVTGHQLVGGAVTEGRGWVWEEEKAAPSSEPRPGGGGATDPLKAVPEYRQEKTGAKKQAELN